MLVCDSLPQSSNSVGAALLCEDGTIITGCNVENASYGLTVCAERIAIFKAVSMGYTRFTAIGIVTRDGGVPCGACRQVMREFADPKAFEVICGFIEDSKPNFIKTLDELLPESFGPENLL